jgi:hypothetical protein
MSHIGTFRNGIAISTARYSWLDWFTGFERPMPGFLTLLKPPDDLLVHGATERHLIQARPSPLPISSRVCIPFEMRRLRCAAMTPL